MAQTDTAPSPFDRTNAWIAAGVLIFTWIIYHLTVQRSIPFWDCGEFIACSAILGIPHPPGTPFFVVIGRLFSLLPIGEDISHRINYISVVSSALCAMMSYLVTVRMIRFFFPDQGKSSLNRFICYIGGIAAGMFVAFGETFWGNAVEAEVYGLSLFLMTLMVWLTMKYVELRDTPQGIKIKILVFYLALLGVSIHMTVFLVVPILSVFFLLRPGAAPKDWKLICGFILLELLLIFAFSNVGNGRMGFYVVSAALALVLLVLLYKEINWAVAIAVVSVCSIMISFELFFWLMGAGLLAVLIGLGMSWRGSSQIDWRVALGILVVAALGFSSHLYLPIRSAQNPRINEGTPHRDFRTFVAFLDRKQYGGESMTDRMFQRRGTWANQFGRHPNMGYWSYFEEQYSPPRWGFVIPFVLGVLGMVVAVQKRLELGLPFMTLFLACSVGLILYMNFADGTKYDFNTGDAYLEVRNRDYFFTPAFVFFGIAMGMGVGAVMAFLKQRLERAQSGMTKLAVHASAVLLVLPGMSLATNYHTNDRSENRLAYQYARNLLDSCEPNAIFFTSGDNDTFPVWCLQEAYNYRKDIRVVNLSLLQTDWYVEQMKNVFGVPISLSDSQIIWSEKAIAGDQVYYRPAKRFNDRPRGMSVYMFPYPYENRLVKVSEMMTDEIVLENRWRDPIFFSAPPYAESPLRLRDRVAQHGTILRLVADTTERGIDLDRSYDLYMNTYQFDGLQDSRVYRDENASGVFVGLGVNAVKVIDELSRRGDTTRAQALAERLMRAYPEYWQIFTVVADRLDRRGDSAQAQQVLQRCIDTLRAFAESNRANLYYKQDLGLMLFEMGQRRGDNAQSEEGLRLMWQAFEADRNSAYGFRKLVSSLYRLQRYDEITRAATMFSEYKVNLYDPLLQQVLGTAPPGGAAPFE